MELETRPCTNVKCKRTFKVLTTSAQKTCSSTCLHPNVEAFENALMGRKSGPKKGMKNQRADEAGEEESAADAAIPEVEDGDDSKNINAEI